MGKNDFLETIGTVAAAIGGAWILSEIIKGLSRPVYRCPCCNRIIQRGSNVCPYCKADLRW